MGYGLGNGKVVEEVGNELEGGWMVENGVGKV